MKIKKYEIVNVEKETIENIEAYGFCDYCKDPVLLEDNFKKRKNKLYHEDCWVQKHL